LEFIALFSREIAPIVRAGASLLQKLCQGAAQAKSSTYVRFDEFQLANDIAAYRFG
jgi:hypothetical protein